MSDLLAEGRHVRCGTYTRGIRGSNWLGASRLLRAWAALLALFFAPAALAEAPERLKDTGLYADWGSRTLAAGLIEYSPVYPLWTDGAIKRRWIHLPPGTFVDASDPDHWRFPVGTRLWKEFAFGGRPVETRYIERTANGWTYATYAWSSDGREAVLAPARGIPRAHPIRAGVQHSIPGTLDCQACHEGRRSTVLGFSLLQLSAQRDPNALHAEDLADGAKDLEDLLREGLVRKLPAHLVKPARVRAGTPTANAAVGYLHGNCGHCHNSDGPLGYLGMDLWHGAAAETLGVEPGSQTTVEQLGGYVLPGTDDVRWRLHPRKPEHSAVLQRMSTRNPIQQMPPLGTNVVDEEAIRVIQAWLEELKERKP